ncbi:hypothetical protein ACFLYK_03365 [Candidatus Cloacimonadota bacterium]
MLKKIRDLIADRRRNRNSRKTNKKMILMNIVGFSIILLLSLEESCLYVKILLLVYVTINLFLFLFWKKIRSDLDTLVFFLNAFVSFVTSLDFYSNGSKYVYIVYLIMGLFFLFLAIRKIIRSQKRKNQI